MASAIDTPPTSVDLRRIQRTRKWVLRGAFVLALALLPFIESYWYARARSLYTVITWVGVALILCCICGRTWCALYIGGRKRLELVTIGPYSLMRHPLYFFTLVGVFGIGAQSGSLLVAGVMTLITFVVFYRVASSEEKFLQAAFPAEFAAYASAVPRLLPRVSGSRDVDELSFRPRLVRDTFLDSCIFLAGIPAVDLLAYLQRSGLVPTLLLLP